MKKLKVEFTQHKNVVLMEVLEMDESLRGIGEFFQYEDLKLRSQLVPELGRHDIYVRGSRKEIDSFLCCYAFNNKSEAKNYIKKANLCIEAYNKSIESGFGVRDKYWTIDCCGSIVWFLFNYNEADKFRIASKNAFKTKKEAERKLEILNFINENKHEFSDDEWKDVTSSKWQITADKDHRFIGVKNGYHDFHGGYYFKDKQTAQKVADFIGYDDFVKYL